MIQQSEKRLEYKDSTAAINKRLKEETKVERKQDLWVYEIETLYWMQNDVVISGNNPHPYLREKIV